MDSWLRISVLLVVFSSAMSCLTSEECIEGQYCCKSHCTPRKIRCNDLCNRDEDCARKELCVQHMCIACSKRLSCDVKTCFNNTNCPIDYECSNGKCAKVEPGRALVSFLPFVIIIGVLGFALFILCYTEGCWKELVQYMKRRYADYGSLAREEWEAEEPEDVTVGESERCLQIQRHSRRKTRGHEGETENTLNDHNMGCTSTCDHNTTQQTTDLPTHVTTTQTVSYDRETNSISIISMMDQIHIRRGLRSIFLREMTSPNARAICQQQRNQTELNFPSGGIPEFTRTLELRDSRSVESLPTYCSLFSEEENEPPPPRYEDVMNSTSGDLSTTIGIPHIIRHASSFNSQISSVAETVV